MAFICFNCFAQDTTKIHLPLKDGYIYYENVVTVDSTVSRDALYNSAKTWFVNNFKSAKAVIQSENPVNGRFLGTATLEVPASLLIIGTIGDQVKFKIQLDVKKGKYRYKIYDFWTQFYDLNHNWVEHPLEPGYQLYMVDKSPKGIIISRANLNLKITQAYGSMVSQINGLIYSLQDSMNKSKQDDF